MVTEIKKQCATFWDENPCGGNWYSQKNDDKKGTALIELFGVPILKAFSNKQCRKMFSDFSSVEISNHQPGFKRNCDIIRCLEPLRSLFRKFDQLVYNCWGFY